MAIIHITRNEIPLKAYLRADPYSQVFRFTDNAESLVTKEMFWGNNEDKDDRIYLHYSDIKNKSIEVSEGISEKSLRQILINNDCEKWIENNIMSNGITRLYVIQGYAGCGKTTFINHIRKTRRSFFRDYYVDIGKHWSYPSEPYMFYTESVNKLYDVLLEISKLEEKREKIWDCFVELGMNSHSVDLDSSVHALINTCNEMKKSRTWENLIPIVYQYIEENYSERKMNRTGTHNIGRTPTIVSLLLLLICAISIVDGNAQELTASIIFDNLDVITNPAIPAENVLNLWGVIDNYILFKQKIESETEYILPNFQILITIRKVLYSHIVSHLPGLEMPLDLNKININVCDISNLYSSQDIMAHRMIYWGQKCDSHIKSKLNRIKDIISIHDNSSAIQEGIDDNDFDLKAKLNIDAFLNHNYRAFSNIHATLIDDEKYYKIIARDFEVSSTKDWQKVSTFIYLVSFIYRKEKVWASLGFGCNYFDTIDYPTTLNRLILNYLFLAKQGNDISLYTNSSIKGIPEDNCVSLDELLRTLKKATFITVKTDSPVWKIKKNYESQKGNGSEELIIERLADMCARNPREICSKVTGYDSDDDELWRRPLYFIGGVKLYHTASSSQELKNHFLDSIRSNTTDQILFSITDEGFILISDIVASFEFYSARYCDENFIKPLHQVDNKIEIDRLITPVYDAIKNCCIRNLVFENQYTSAYDLNNRDEYLCQFFHPRTKPHYYENSKELKDYSFRPQLHIVRVIYNHIFYFDNIKELLSFSNNSSKNEMCKCLTDWIEKYLNLYSTYFFKKQVNTLCKSDNKVCKELRKKLKKQKVNYSNGDYTNIKIRLMKYMNQKKKK